MKLTDILKTAQEGQRFRRADWVVGRYLVLGSGSNIQQQSGMVATASPPGGLDTEDLLAEDWVALDPVYIEDVKSNKIFYREGVPYIKFQGEFYQLTHRAIAPETLVLV